MPTLPIYLTGHLKMSYEHTGLVVAAFPITGILIRPFAGYIIDNYHRSMVFLLSLSLVALLFGAYPLVTGVVAMFLLRLLHGVGWGISTSSIPALVADAVPAARLGQAMGIFALGTPIGMTLGAMFGLAILERLGPVSMFLSIFAICLLSLLIAFFGRTPSTKFTRTRFALTNVLHGKATPLSFCMFLVMVPYGAIITFAGI